MRRWHINGFCTLPPLPNSENSTLMIVINRNGAEYVILDPSEIDIAPPP